MKLKGLPIMRAESTPLFQVWKARGMARSNVETGTCGESGDLSRRGK